MKIMTGFVTLLGSCLATWIAHAGELAVPHQPGDKISVYVRPGLYAHPTDYWWQKDPSSQGTWNYFTPVDQLYQPVRLETQPSNSPQVAPTIPVTHRIFW